MGKINLFILCLLCTTTTTKKQERQAKVAPGQKMILEGVGQNPNPGPAFPQPNPFPGPGMPTNPITGQSIFPPGPGFGQPYPFPGGITQSTTYPGPGTFPVPGFPQINPFPVPGFPQPDPHWNGLGMGSGVPGITFQSPSVIGLYAQCSGLLGPINPAYLQHLPSTPGMPGMYPPASQQTQWPVDPSNGVIPPPYQHQPYQHQPNQDPDLIQLLIKEQQQQQQEQKPQQPRPPQPRPPQPQPQYMKKEKPLSIGDTDYGYVPYFGVGTYKFHKELITWEEAKQVCASEGANLAVINSQEEADLLTKMMHNHSLTKKDMIFLGFSDNLEEGKFVTVDGESLEDTGYERWQTGEPDNGEGSGGGPENCGSMDTSGMFHDVHCTNEKMAFMCEK